MSVEDVISYFYTKKKRYDSKINKKKKNIREDPELSLEEKRIDIRILNNLVLNVCEM